MGYRIGKQRRCLSRRGYRIWRRRVDAADIDRFALMGICQGGAPAITYAVGHQERVSHLILAGAYSRGWQHRDNPEALKARHAFETLVRLDWELRIPPFPSILPPCKCQKTPRPNTRNGLTTYAVCQRLPKMRHALWKHVTRSTCVHCFRRSPFQPSCFTAMATARCRPTRSNPGSGDSKREVCSLIECQSLSSRG